ncbi:hypothetical protein [Paenibacillus pini]|uniref:Uncharacterized protein n=1 Tax=Paenibacillus pini JCM 16418 TaxID=1236976 RepID=W7YAF4_9BACL|nr:hypothetical protein [Paenibacillus pini]GAF08025.1 hypothetical protein JCM16418_2062 [Paenibacillus pini JCM 16418]
MAGSNTYKVNVVTDVQDLIKNNNELKATTRYIDQIQRLSDRLGRARYQSLIKLNTELRYMQRNLGNIYSLAIRLSRLRIMPKVYLIDHATPVLNALIRKLKRLKDIYIQVWAKTNHKENGKPSGRGQDGNTNGGNSLGISSNKSNIVNKSVQVSSTVEINDPQFNFNFNRNIEVKIKPPKITLKKGAIKFAPKLTIKAPKAAQSTPKIVNRIKVTCKCCCCKKGKSKRGSSDKERERKKGTIRETPNNDPRNPNSEDKRKPKSKSKPKIESKTESKPKSVPESKKPKPKIGRPSPKGSKGLGKLIDLGKDLFEGKGGKAIKSFSKGMIKKSRKLLGPVSYLADIADIATAPHEQRNAAIGNAVGGVAGAAIGGAIGTAILPGIGTWVGSTLGGMAGSAVGEWIGNKAPQIGEWVGDKASAIGDWVTDKAGMLGDKVSKASDWISGKTEGLKSLFGFSSKKEEPAKPKVPTPVTPTSRTNEILAAATPSLQPGGRLAGPPYIGSNNVSRPLYGPTLPSGDSKAVKGMPQIVQITEEQMSSLSGFLKDFKTETTNQINVSVPAGAVQLTVRENEIDYESLTQQVGQRLVGEVRRAMENRKTVMV